MGQVLCAGRVAANTASEYESMWITVPTQNHIYPVSKPLTRPELVDCDGRTWIRYDARVLHRFTITRQVHDE